MDDKRNEKKEINNKTEEPIDFFTVFSIIMKNKISPEESLLLFQAFGLSQEVFVQEAFGFSMRVLKIKALWEQYKADENKYATDENVPTFDYNGKEVVVVRAFEGDGSLFIGLGSTDEEDSELLCRVTTKLNILPQYGYQYVDPSENEAYELLQKIGVIESAGASIMVDDSLIPLAKFNMQRLFEVSVQGYADDE